MATFLDLGVLNFFLPAFTFLFVLVIMYAILHKTNFLGKSNLVKMLAAVFVDNEKIILDGKLYEDLISLIPKEKYLAEIMNVSIKKIYRSKGIVEREVAGYEVLGGLLDTFIHAYNEKHSGNLSPKNRAIVNLLPQRLTSDINNDLYERLLRVIDFVSGMTDSSAVSLFRKIKGISLPASRVVE